MQDHRRRGFQVCAGALALLALLAAIVWWWGEPVGPPAPELPPAGVDLASVRAPEFEPPRGASPPAPDPLEEELRFLKNSLRERGDRRLRTVIDRCIKLGPKAVALLPELREMVAEPPEERALHAMVAIMRIEGSHTFFDVVLDTQSESLLRKFNPDAPFALKEALRWWKLKPDLRGIRAACAGVARGESEVAATIVSQVSDSGAAEIFPWLRIAFHLDPIPAELGAVIAHRLRIDGARVGPHIACALHTKRVDYAPIREAVMPALLERVPLAPDPELGHLLPAIVNLGGDGPQVMDPILDLLDRPGYPATRAVAAISSLGPRAGSAIPRLIERADRCEPKYRGWYVETLGGIASVEAVPAFNRWMHDAPERVAVKIVHAILRCDPEVETSAAVDALVAALRNPSFKVRGAAAVPLRRLSKVPPVLEQALSDLPGR